MEQAEPEPERSGAEVLGRVMQLLDDDPLAFFILSQRMMFRRTYRQIADRLTDLNPHRVSPQAIHKRVKVMAQRLDGSVNDRVLMPRVRTER